MRKLSFVFMVCILAFHTKAQNSLSQPFLANDTILAVAEISKTNAISDTIKVVSTMQAKDSLLPSQYLFTQRWLWGENGSKRKNGKYPLTLEGRQHEMDIRANLNKWHRIAGYTALVGIAASGVTGQMLSDGNENARTYHQIFTGITDLSYISSLALAAFSPPPMKDRESGFTKVNIHRTLAIIHGASMLATNVLSAFLPNNPDLVPYHRAAAITAFSTLFAATIVINL